MNLYWVQAFFADKYHDLNISQNLSVGQTRYHSANDVVSIMGIASALDNLTLYATLEHIHMDQLVVTTHQLKETNKILRDHTKNLDETKKILESHLQDKEKTSNKNESYLEKLEPDG